MSKKAVVRCAVPYCHKPRERNEPGEWVLDGGQRVWICNSCVEAAK